MLLHFVKWMSLVGFVYFGIIGLLCVIKFEPLKIKHSSIESSEIGAFIASGVSFYIIFRCI